MKEIFLLTLLLLTGCQAQPTKMQPTPQRTTWRIVERPLNDANFHATCSQQGRDCYFRTEGIWRSSTGKAGGELVDPTSVTITCNKAEKQSMEIEASVGEPGFLGSDEIDFRVSSWSDDQIIATTVAGLCDIGRQLVIDLPGKTAILRTYPTKEVPAEDTCALFSVRNSLVLHGGHWQLQPLAPREF